MTRNIQAIQASMCLNPSFKDRITIVHAAMVSPDELGTKCVIRAGVVNSGNGILKCGEVGQVQPCKPGELHCQEVSVKSLDMLLSELALSSVDVVKVDVE